MQQITSHPQIQKIYYVDLQEKDQNERETFETRKMVLLVFYWYFWVQTWLMINMNYFERFHVNFIFFLFWID